MTFRIPVVDLEVGEAKELVWNKLQEPQNQRRLILVIVSIALLLDNMLYMVIVPIIPDYLRYIGAYKSHPGETSITPVKVGTNATIRIQPTISTLKKFDHHGEDASTGVLFASKAIVQLMVNPFSGALIDRIGYDIPMMIGLTIMFLSTTVFACGRSYGLLFFARSLQGVGSAFADTSGLAMIADSFTEEAERSKALGIALAFISFGCLVAPPFGGALYQFAGKEVPFLILAFVSLIDGFMLLLVMKPIKTIIRESKVVPPDTVPIWKLLMDPYIAVCAGALMMANVALAFLEPTISRWMEDTMTSEYWQIGMIWLPAFIPHVLGVVFTVKMARKYPRLQWAMAAGGLALEGVSCFVLPYCKTYILLMIPICTICFGIALVDTSLLPMLGYLVDVRYVSVYGSIYAIADISYSIAYAVGPIIAGGVIDAIGFTALNFIIAFTNLAYAPVIGYLRNIYDFKPFENEANILMSDPPAKEYQTYSLQDQRVVDGEVKNHLEYTQPNGNYAETNMDGSSEGYQNYQAQSSYDYQQGNQSYDQQNQGYQQQSQGYQQQPYQPEQPTANPFRQQQQQQPPAQPSSGISNPFRSGTGWRETLTNLPKKLLSGVSFATDSPAQEEVLPKLPVPRLEDTLQRYLEAVKPLVTQTQYENTQAIVREFGSAAGLGPKLQEYLLERRQLKDNWAYEYWLNDMYLNVTLPLPVWSNPGAILPPQQFSHLRDMARYGAAIVDACLTRKEILDRKELVVERAASREKGQPLCMDQYYRLLTSYRVAAVPRDQIFSTLYQEDGSTEHIIIIHKNQLYSLVVKGHGSIGQIVRLSTQQITQELVKILESPRSARATPVGLLTAHKRDAWATARDLLRLDTQNADNLEVIEKCLLVVCFDEPLPESFNLACPSSEKPKPVGFRAGQRDETSMMHQMLHGGGSLYNGANRWNDKTVQIIISKDGVVGALFEHSPADGMIMYELMDYVVAKLRDLPPDIVANEEQIPDGMNASKMEWLISPDVQKHIHEAARALDMLAEDLDYYAYRYTGYGKEWIKSAKCSPDAFIQMALQLAQFKLYGHLVATYESASTRRFQNGRIDCIRSATCETLAWVQAMAAEEEESGKRVSFTELDDTKRLELFDNALKKQTEIMVQNILGEGIDIHLLGLREAARETSGGIPPIFLDDTYRVANRFALSTSQIATKEELFGGYGPVIPEGYGASYNPRKEEIIFGLSAWHSCARTSTWRFARALEYALGEMRRLLSTRDPTLK